MIDVCFIIPARGGSKGIPGKNIKDFNDKPLIAWTIEACKETKLGPVYVSSDSDSILETARKYGAFCIKRPVELSNDTSSSEDAVIHALNTMTSLPSTTFFMQCTSPWITSTDILSAWEKWSKNEWDSMIFAKHNHNYFGQYFSEEESKKLVDGEPSSAYFPNSLQRKMRQEMNRQVIEVGAYIFDTKRFLIEKNRQCGLQTAYIIDRELPPEIDSLIDWEINERYFNYWRGVKEYGKNNKAN